MELGIQGFLHRDPGRRIKNTLWGERNHGTLAVWHGHHADFRGTLDALVAVQAIDGSHGCTRRLHRFQVGHLRRAGLGFNAGFVANALHGDIQVQLPHSRENQAP